MIHPLQMEDFSVGPGNPLLLIAGPCVIEDTESPRIIAEHLAQLADRHGLSLVFKASYDKANRTSINSFRGPGVEKGLAVLDKIRKEFGIPVLSDVHRFEEIEPAAEVLDIIQIPAFLCRQTDLLIETAKTGKPVNVKKGQFMGPWDMNHAVAKIRSAGNDRILLTERGAMFGYNNLVVDMRSIPIMQSTGCPVIFDATHSIQLPGGAGSSSGGQREFAPTLARAAVAAGADGVFMEVHPQPEKAKCDGPNSLPLDELAPLLSQLLQIRDAVSSVHSR